jgi:hypothetical protein
MLFRLPDRLKDSTTSAFAPEEAMRAKAATAPALASLLVKKENNVRPPASASDPCMDSPN